MPSESISRTIGRNPNLFRKSYGFSRRKPEIYEFVDVNSGITRSLDFQKVVRDRDFFVVRSGEGLFVPPPLAPEILLAEYDEDIITFDGEDEIFVSFNFTFTEEPIIVFEVETDNEGVYDGGPTAEGVNLFGLSMNTDSFTIATSAPFFGTIRYMAVYSPTYPALVTRSIAPDPGVPFLVSATQYTPEAEDTFDVSYPALPGSYSRTLYVAHDPTELGVSNAYLSASHADNDNVIIDASDVLSSPVHIIAFD